MDIKLTHADNRLLAIVWESEPILSPDLCKLAETHLGWKRTTTYTVLKRLCDKKLLNNKNALVTSLISKEAVQKNESRKVVQRVFDGSLPLFIAAFLDGGKISETEAEKIKQLIDAFREKR